MAKFAHPCRFQVHLSTAILMSLACAACAAEGAFNYAEALQKAVYFYECQRSGVLPPNNRVEWRGDSGLSDGKEAGVDLTGGWYDAGDHVKFGLPAASSLTLLAWSVLEYREGYEKSGQLAYMLDSLRWEADFIVKCHTAPNEFYGQVGGGELDHRWWGAPEVLQMARPAFKIDAQHPGSDLAGEAAAALAATATVFKKTDPKYAEKLVGHAKQLYAFADTYRGKYSDSINDARNFYNSFSGFQDELVWGAAWLNVATGDAVWLAKAELEYKQLSTQPQSAIKSYKWTQNWDDKSYGCYVLLARLTGKAQYQEDAERWLDYWSDGYKGERIKYTTGGLAWLEQWGTLRYAANTAMLAFIYSDTCADAAHKTRYREFAARQIDYILGKNPQARSYVVGFGNNPPRNPHHRGAHGTWLDNLQEPVGSRHVLYGALVGGPDANDTYADNRGDFIKNEVALDYNAGFTGALARMAREFGGVPLKDFPPAEKRDDEFFVEAKVNASGPRFVEISALINNRSAWPARIPKKLSFKYFVDLSEVFAAGHALGQVAVNAPYSQGSGISPLTVWNAEHKIFFIEVFFDKDPPYPGGQSHFKKEAQFRIALPSNTNKPEWDNANDWSFEGLAAGEHKKTARIPVYSEGKLLFGLEPPKDGRAAVAVRPAETAQAPEKKAADAPAAPVAPGVKSALQLFYKNTDPNASSNQIKFHLKLTNGEKAGVPLSEIALRYWFKNADGAELQFFCDYSTVGGSNVTGKFAKLTPPRPGADAYLELGFSAAAGTLAVGQDVEIQVRAAKKDWKNFEQAGDYSCDAGKSAYALMSRMGLYRKGVLAGGAEPVAGNDKATR